MKIASEALVFEGTCGGDSLSKDCEASVVGQTSVYRLDSPQYRVQLWPRWRPIAQNLFPETEQDIPYLNTDRSFQPGDILLDKGQNCFGSFVHRSRFCRKACYSAKDAHDPLSTRGQTIDAVEDCVILPMSFAQVKHSQKFLWAIETRLAQSYRGLQMAAN